MIDSPAKSFYDRKVPYRETLESEWEDAAELTLPYLFKHDDTEDFLPTPYNSTGAAAVNNLASKLLLALIPPTGTFFRLLPDVELTNQLSKEDMDKLDVELSKVEQDVVEIINQRAVRVPVYEALKLLIVTGNAMLYKIPNGSFKVFSAKQYVVERDFVGNVVTACIKERISQSVLPDDVIKLLEDAEPSSTTDECQKCMSETEYDVYTLIRRVSKGKYEVVQEINSIEIPGSRKSYKEEELPYFILRWTAASNEDYGRGLVQQYIGDFRSLEGLTQTIVDGSAVMAKILFGVRPGSTLKVEDLNNAPIGGFVLGDLERELTSLQVNKNADFNTAYTLLGALEQRIGRAFMMLSGQIRDSERTTAAEVRAVASELETTLGGTYTVLAADFQQPLVYQILKELNPDVLKVTVPSITTGISAISRERDFQNLNTMLQALAQLGPEVVQTYLDIPAYLEKIATSLGIEPDAIVKSKEQIQQEQQAALQQQQQLQQQQADQQMQLEQMRQQGGK